MQTFRHNADTELAKDVMRAEEATVRRGDNPRQAISDARVAPGVPVSIRLKSVFDLVRNHMKKEGVFFNLTSEFQYYIPHDIGRPIQLSTRSEQLRMYMFVRYGINASESEYKYIAEGLLAHTLAQPSRGNEGVLSYYDPDRESILIHSGKKDIWRITKNSINLVPNGTDDTVFLWDSSSQSFTINN